MGRTGDPAQPLIRSGQRIESGRGEGRSTARALPPALWAAAAAAPGAKAAHERAPNDERHGTSSKY